MASTATTAPKRMMPKNEGAMSLSLVWMYRAALHLVCVAVYAIPMFLYKSPQDHGFAVLDELHIVTHEHKDIYIPDDNNDDDNDDACSSNDSLWFYWMCSIRNDPVWTNDYWGRSMSWASSHKSWRPLTILSFRYLRFAAWWNDLTSHRVVNVLLHTATAEFVALLALAFLCTPSLRRRPPQQQQQSTTATSSITSSPAYAFWLYTLTKLLFALHPTHVEATANAANRPHLIAVACTALLAHPQTPLPLFVVVLIVGFLSAETFLFGTVPAAATMVLIHYRQHYQKPRRRTTSATSEPLLSLWTQSWRTLRYCSLRIILLVAGGVAYYGGRAYLDWLSIPSGLIRPAENPYFRLTGRNRLYNYAHVAALHVAKAWDLDWVGFSHEYGVQCLTPIDADTPDARVWIPVSLVGVLVIVPLIWFLGMGRCVSSKQPIVEGSSSAAGVSAPSNTTPEANGHLASSPQAQQRRVAWSTALLLWLFHLSWLVTLFPIMGIVKIGTFVADRLVITSSVSVCILVAHLLASWLATSSWSGGRAGGWCGGVLGGGEGCSPCCGGPLSWRLGLVLAVLAMGWRRIHLRTWEWMDPHTLLKSSLVTCPRLAKSHLEISKIYSGLYPQYYNLTKARWHLQQVQAIDPDYCDVHYQFVHVALQDEAASLLEVEEELKHSLVCAFTMGGAMELWKRYWELALSPLMAGNSKRSLESAQQRQQEYRVFLQQAMEEGERQQQAEEARDEAPHSHFVNFWRS